MIFGIDVSVAQGVIDWARVASKPCVSTHPRTKGLDLVPRFVIAKASEAQGYVDPQFGRNASEARARGLVAAAYHFFWGHRDPVAQAAHFFDTAAHLVTTCPVLDFEGVPYRGKAGFADIDAIGAVAVLHAARVFGEETERLWGRPLVVYTGPGWMAQFPEGDDLAWLAQRALWVAHYTDGEPMAVRGWGKRWSAHQFDGGNRTKLPTGQAIDANLAADTAWLEPLRDTDPAPFDPTPPALRLSPTEVPSLEQVLQELTEPPPDSTEPTNPGTPTSKSSDRLHAVRPEET